MLTLKYPEQTEPLWNRAQHSQGGEEDAPYPEAYVEHLCHPIASPPTVQRSTIGASSRAAPVHRVIRYFMTIIMTVIITIK